MGSELHVYGPVRFKGNVAVEGTLEAVNTFYHDEHGTTRPSRRTLTGEDDAMDEACTCADVEDKIKAASDDTKQQVEMLQAANTALEARLARLEAMLVAGAGQTIQDRDGK